MVPLAAELTDDDHSLDLFAGSGNRIGQRRRPGGRTPTPAQRAKPALAALIGAADATVAVPEAAQAVVAAALAAFTQRTPLLVITATGLDAGRLGDDLSCLIAPEGDGPDAGGVVGALEGPVTVLPAWETLP